MSAVLRLLVLLVASIRRVSASYRLKHVLRLTQSNHEQTRRKRRDFECGALRGRGGRKGVTLWGVGLKKKPQPQLTPFGGGHSVGGSQRTLGHTPKGAWA